MRRPPTHSSGAARRPRQARGQASWPVGGARRAQPAPVASPPAHLRAASARGGLSLWLKRRGHNRAVSLPSQPLSASPADLRPSLSSTVTSLSGAPTNVKNSWKRPSKTACRRQRTRSSSRWRSRRSPAAGKTLLRLGGSRGSLLPAHSLRPAAPPLRSGHSRRYDRRLPAQPSTLTWS